MEPPEVYGLPAINVPCCPHGHTLAIMDYVSYIRCSCRYGGHQGFVCGAPSADRRGTCGAEGVWPPAGKACELGRMVPTRPRA